jgi:hypothetical protein
MATNLRGPWRKAEADSLRRRYALELDHDMMAFALEYRKPIDSITADKSLKLRKYELDNEGWGIIEQLVSVLQVSTAVLSANTC